MIWLGYAVLTVLAVVGLLLAALVAVPLRLRAAGRVTGEAATGLALATWGFGLVGVAASSERGTYLLLAGRPVWRIRASTRRASRKAADERSERPRPRAGAAGRGRLRALWRHASTWRALLARIVRTFNLRVRLQGTVGLDDPADTAMLVGALRTLDGLAERAEIDVTPDYLGDVFDLSCELSARVWLLAMLWVGASALFELRTWRLLRDLA